MNVSGLPLRRAGRRQAGMSDIQVRSVRAMKHEVSAERGGSLLQTIRRLWPYIWPHERLDLKRRVTIAMALLMVAKLATIAVPFTFKWATDALTGEGSAPVAPAWIGWVFLAPVALTIAYGGMRILMALVTQGRNGIETIVRMVILQAAPTIIELLLIVAVLLYMFDWRYVAVIFVTIVGYTSYTYFATEWRIGIRRRMNESDSDANTKAIDSLLNYETVKYFSAEEREARRYDKSMERYEVASVNSYVSLAVLNAGQATIFAMGLTATMVLCVSGIRDGTNTIGDFVMINAMMIQLYQPLNFMGMVYREIKQGVIDIEIMFSILGREAEIKDRPGAPPLEVTNGVIRF